MARYRCSVCGYVFDEEKEGKRFQDLKECPVCKQPPERFMLLEEQAVKKKDEHAAAGAQAGLEYPSDGGQRQFFD